MLNQLLLAPFAAAAFMAAGVATAPVDNVERSPISVVQPLAASSDCGSWSPWESTPVPGLRDRYRWCDASSGKQKLEFQFRNEGSSSVSYSYRGYLSGTSCPARSRSIDGDSYSKSLWGTKSQHRPGQVTSLFAYVDDRDASRRWQICFWPV